MGEFEGGLPILQRRLRLRVKINLGQIIAGCGYARNVSELANFLSELVNFVSELACSAVGLACVGAASDKVASERVHGARRKLKGS